MLEAKCGSQQDTIKGLEYDLKQYAPVKAQFKEEIKTIKQSLKDSRQTVSDLTAENTELKH